LIAARDRGHGRRSRRGGRLGLATLVVFVALAVAASAASATPSISIVGNHFVDGAGNPVRLLGVNRTGPEYACTFGEIAAGPVPEVNPLTDADAAAIASWHATAVRLPLNEDCWLGTHGMPAEGLTVSEYREAIVAYVNALGARGLYVILDLHWSNPRDLEEGEGQHPMPDALSVPFWESVASTFAGDPGVVFDAYNEPYSPSNHGDPSHPVDWSCWLEGGCAVPAAPDIQPPNPKQTYLAFGMQQMVDAIRAGGATQPILLGGLEYANDLSQWLSHEPSDPDGQLAASFHNYPDQECNAEDCWNSVIATVAASVPVVTGEFDEFDCAVGTDPANFDNRWMNWADAHGVSYLAWGWVIPEGAECHTDYLITDYNGTPAEPNGVALHAHLAALAEPPATTPPSSPTPLNPSPLPTPTPKPAPGHTTTLDRAAIGTALAADLRNLGKLPPAAKVAAGKWKPKLTAPGAGTLSLQLLVAGAHRSAAAANPLARATHTFAAAGTTPVPVTATKAGATFLLAHSQAPLTAKLTFTAGSTEPVVKTLPVHLKSKH
jgi:endoglucanase